MPKNVNEKLNIKESVFPLVVRLIWIEVLFALISLILTYLLTNPGLNFGLKNAMFSLKIMSRLVITIIKVWLIVVVVTKWSNSKYIVTNSGISFNYGFFKNNQKNFSCRNIERIELKQGLIGRLANFGHIKLYSPLLEREIYLNNVSNPKVMINKIKKLLSNQKAQIIYKK